MPGLLGADAANDINISPERMTLLNIMSKDSCSKLKCYNTTMNCGLVDWTSQA